MSDVLEGGRPDRRRPVLPPGPRNAAIAVLLTVAIAVLVVVMLRDGSAGNSAKPQPTELSRSQLAPGQRADGGVVGVKDAPWPAASGACGSTAYLPIGEFATQLPTQYAATNGSFLVGGAHVWPLRVSAVTGVTPPVPMTGLPAGATAMVDAFASSPDGDYALVSSCNSTTGSAVYRVSGTSMTKLDTSGVLMLVGGVHHTWAVSAATDPAPSAGPSDEPPERITPLGGGRPLVLNPGAYLVADVASGLIVATNDPDGGEAPPVLTIVDPATGGLVRSLSAAFPLAAQGTTLLAEAGACSLDSPCTLLRIDLGTGAVVNSYSLPTGRLPASGVVFSADGSRVALQLTQANPDQRFSTGHPFPPSGVTVLDLATGKLSDVSNLELAAKTSVGLAFDETASSLFIVVDQGDRSDVLIWQAGMAAPAFVTSLPGAVAGPIPVVALS